MYAMQAYYRVVKMSTPRSMNNISTVNIYTNGSKTSSHSILQILVPFLCYNTYQVAVKALEIC